MNMKPWSVVRRALTTTALIASLGLSAHAGGGRPTVSESDSDFTKTRYPIVLAHGLFGFNSVAGVDYFFGIPRALRAKGATVYTPQVPAANTSEVRGEALLKYLRELKATYGHQKFNLIGHSHGSHSVRYVAGVAPDLVASVLVVGGPNRGTVIADFVLTSTGTLGLTQAVGAVVNALTKAAGGVMGVVGGSVGGPQDSVGATRSLSTTGSAAFNKNFPAGMPQTACGSGEPFVNGIYYFSATGIKTGTSLLDPADWGLNAASVFFLGTPNDGLVSKCSAKWGSVLRDDYAWNHLDEINQTFGIVGHGVQDPVSFYRTHANRLKSLGL